MGVDRAVNIATRVTGTDEAKQAFMDVGKAANDTVDQIAAAAKAQAGLEAATSRAGTASTAYGAALAAARQETANLKAQLKSGEIGLEQYTVAIQAQNSAMAVVKAEHMAAKVAVDAMARSLVAAKTGTGELALQTSALTPVLNHAIAGHQGMSVSAMIMMHSVRSATDSFAAGLPATMIFTEQLARLGEAASLSGGGEGALGKLGAFMGTGWGVAITVGVSVLGTLISHLLSSRTAADEARKAHETLAEKLDLEKNSYVEVTKAIDDYNRAQEKSRQTTLDAGIEAANATATNIGKAIEERGRLEADLKAALAKVGNPDPAGGDISNELGTAAEIARLKLEISKNDELLKKLSEGAHNAVVDIGTQLGTMAADERVQIQKTFEQRIKHAGDRLKTEKEVAAEVKRLTLEETAALEAYDAKHKAILSGSAQTAQFGSPIPGAPITSGYGIREAPMHGASTNHLGVDYGARFGTPVLAAMDGIVKFANAVAGYGNEIAVSHGAGTESRYAHLSRFAVKEGEEVAKGQVIGYVGQTGTATGPHLHFEVLVNGKKVDPTKGAYPVDATKAAEEGERARKLAAEKAQQAADKATRNQKEFADQSADLDRNLLEAKKAGITDAGQLATIARAEVQSAHDKLAADIEAKVRLRDYSKAQGDELKLKNDALLLQRQHNIAVQEQERRAKEALNVEIATLSSQQDLLQAAGALALGSKDRREIQLRMLELEKEEARLKLEAILASKTTTAAEKEIAALQLKNLNALYGLKTESANRQNASPGQAYVNELTKNSGQVHDQIEQIKVDGLKTLNDGLVDAIVHFRSLGDVAHSVLDKIATDIVSMGVEKYITLPLAKLLGLGATKGKAGADPSASLSTAGTTLQSAGTALSTAATQLQSAAASIGSSGAGGGLGGGLAGAIGANDNPGDDLASKIYNFGSSVDDASGMLSGKLAAGVTASSQALSSQVLSLNTFGSKLASVLSSLSSGGGSSGGGGLLGSILKLGSSFLGKGSLVPGVAAGFSASSGLVADVSSTIAANAAIFKGGGYLGGFASGGGLLVGPGSETSDSIVAHGPHGRTARFSNGEYIFNAETVRRLGLAKLDQLNRGGVLDPPRSSPGIPFEHLAAISAQAANDRRESRRIEDMAAMVGSNLRRQYDVPSGGVPSSVGAGSSGGRYRSEQHPAPITIIQHNHLPAGADPGLTQSSIARVNHRSLATAARKGLAIGPMWPGRPR